MTESLRLGLTLVALVALGVMSLAWLTIRTTHNRKLCRVILLSYLFRALLAVVLYEISWWGLPLLKSLQQGHGFWGFSLDSYVYDYFGGQIADAWAHGTELPDPQLGFEYFAIVAALYRAFGDHPLYPILLNCWLAASCGWLAYLISRRFLSRQASFTAAVLVSFWPSSFIWSAQLLKDPLSWFLLFAALGLVARLLASGRAVRQPVALREALQWAILGCAVALLTRLRFYVGSALSLAAALLFLPAAAMAFARRNTGAGVRYLSLVAIVVGATVYGRSLNTLQLLSTRSPEQGHVRLAIGYWDNGNLPEARRQFRQAIALRPDYRQAYLELGRLEIASGNLAEAANVYAEYLEKENPEKRSGIRQLITHLHVQLYVKRGNEALKAGQPGQAAGAFERALEFDPSFSIEDEEAGKRRDIRQIITQLYLNQGDEALKAGQPGQAAGAFERALEFDPTCAAAHLKLAVVMAQQLHFTSALVGLERGLQAVKTEEERATLQQAIERVREEMRIKNALETITAVRQQLAVPHSPEDRAQLQQLLDGLLGDPGVQAALTQEATRTQPAGVPPRNAPALLAGLERAAGLPDTLGGRPHLSSSMDRQPDELVRGLSVDLSTIEAEADRLLYEGRAHNHRRQRYRPLKGIPFNFLTIQAQADRMMSESRPTALATIRKGFVASGGHALMDPHVELSSLWRMVGYLPRGLAIGLLAPFPWQWFDRAGSTGVMRLFSSLEMLLLYVLLPGIAVGVIGLVRRRRITFAFIAVFALSMWVAMAVVVANMGTLFRLRLLFLLPLLLIATAGDPFRFWKDLARRLKPRSGLAAPAPSGHPVEESAEIGVAALSAASDPVTGA